MQYIYIYNEINQIVSKSGFSHSLFRQQKNNIIKQG